MIMQSQLEIKQEQNGIVRQQPYEQQHHQHQQQHRHWQRRHHHQQRRIRVLEPTIKYRHRESSGSSSDAHPSSCSVMHPFGERYYHAKLEGSHELVLEANEFVLVWGVTYVTPDEDGEFKLRLLQRPSLYDQQEQEQEQQEQKPQAEELAQSQEQNGPGQEQRLQFKCVEVSRESLDLLCYHEPKIRSLMLSHDKAIIFQNVDVQVYVMEEIKSEGFRVHFQDKLRTKVSLTYQHFLSLISALPRVDHDYLKYKKKLKIKNNKLRVKGLLVDARCE